MPTYLYACARCGQFEWSQCISSVALDRCPTCGEAVQRLIAGGTSVVMKAGEPAGCSRETPCLHVGDTLGLRVACAG